MSITVKAADQPTKTIDVDFKGFDFIALRGVNQKPTNIYDMLKNNYRLYVIQEGNPDELTAATKALKVFAVEHMLYITFNNIQYFTGLVSVNMSNGTSKVQTYKNKCLECPLKSTSTYNAFISNHRMFQVAACRQAMTLSAIDLTKNAVVSNITVNKTDPITFTQGPPTYQIVHNDTTLNYTLAQTEDLLFLLAENRPYLKVIYTGDVYGIACGSYIYHGSFSPSRTSRFVYILDAQRYQLVVL